MIKKFILIIKKVNVFSWALVNESPQKLKFHDPLIKSTISVSGMTEKVPHGHQSSLPNYAISRDY